MRRMALAVAAICGASSALAEGERAGDFDYYVLALSWSPAWCEMEGDARNDPQCDRGRGTTFVMHGLWPQYEIGWPSWCRTTERDPTRSETATMADVMGGAGNAFHQWKKHGRCSGLPADGYFQLARKALKRVAIPDLFVGVTRDLTLPASVIEEAFLASNPSLSGDQITVTCKAGLIQEVRVCLAPDLGSRRCGADVIRDCSLSNAVLEAVR